MSAPAVSAPAVSPGSRCWSWLLPLYVCLQLAPATPGHRHLQLASATDCVRTISSGPHPCLPWSLPAEPWSITEDPNSPSSHCRSPTVLINYYTVDDMNPSSLNCLDSMAFWTQGHHSPRTWCPAPLDPEPQHTPACVHPQVKVFPDWSQSTKSRRGYRDCEELGKRDTSEEPSNRPPRNRDAWTTGQRIKKKNCSKDVQRATRKHRWII